MTSCLFRFAFVLKFKQVGRFIQIMQNVDFSDPYLHSRIRHVDILSHLRDIHNSLLFFLHLLW